MDYCVKFCVNDEPVELTVSGSETLLHVLREKLGFGPIPLRLIFRGKEGDDRS